MKKAVLAAVCTADKKQGFTSAMQETRELCNACGIEVIGECIQQSNSIDPRTVLRSGKLQELAEMAKQTDADGIIFYNPLSVAQAQRISAAAEGLDVIDRKALILDIFSLRARSAQAKIQTEVARLEYDLPKLLQDNMESDHARGGTFNNRGAGETRSVIIRRCYEARISALKAELKQIEAHQETDQAKRKKSALKSVALVGYTNAGKSSLMNAILKTTDRPDRAVFEKDMLFATLDTSIRNIAYKNRQFLLYDTVGFVSDLPHELIDAFKSTLDAARDADLLLIVEDISDPLKAQKTAITMETLKEIHADSIPVLHVHTKADLAESSDELKGICVSSLTMQGIDALLDEIDRALYPSDVTMLCLVPYAQMALIDRGKKTLNIRILESTEEGIRLQASGTKEHMKIFEPYRTGE